MVLRRESTGVVLSPEQMAQAEATDRSNQIANAFFKKWPSFELHLRRDLAPENQSAKYMEAKRQYGDLRLAVTELTNGKVELPEFSELLMVNLESLEEIMQKDYGEPGLGLIGRLSVLMEAVERLKVAEHVQVEETEVLEEPKRQAA